MMETQGASAIVTGGASGLGLATTRMLAGRGLRVLIFDLPSSRGAEVAEELGAGARFHAGDVTRPEQVGEAVSAASELGDLRVAVSCAGVATPGRLVSRRGPLGFEDFMRVVSINLGGTMNLAAHAAAAMADIEPSADERGVIITTASVAAFEGQIGQIAYAASKAGVVGLTLPAARELAALKIRVVSIAPGLFETPMMAGLPDAAREALADKTPHPHRLGRPEEYASMVDQIISNPMLNGTTIRLDGAIRMEAR